MVKPIAQGIDVSRYQGRISWEKVKASGIRFVLIRAGYGDVLSQKDSMFDANIRGAAAAGLDVGVYWFSYAVSVEDAKKEASVFRQIISPYRQSITYPAAYDFESASAQYAQKQGVSFSKELVNQMADAFLSAMKEDGWKTALYTNNDFLRNVFSPEALGAWDVWLADYSGELDAECAIQQTGSSGHVPGVEGCVDTDVSFRDYSRVTSPTAVQIDTAGTYSMAPGGVYQLKTTCAQQPKVWSGSPESVLVLPRYRSGSDDFWWIVAVGRPGEGAGIYTAAPGEQGQRRLVVNITEKT